jgi:uncharacterized OB-fold protein
MPESDPTTSSRPEVTPDERSKPFFEACAAGQLSIRRCAACRAWSAPADPFCSICGGGRLEWAQASGRGTIHTFGVVHHISHPGFRDEAPYNVAVVELEEGPRINTHIIGCANDEIRVGMAVTVDFVRTTNGVVVPKFRPVAS